jgi:Peptidase M15
MEDMKPLLSLAALLLTLAVVVSGCASKQPSASPTSTSSSGTAVPHAHAQAIEPVAGVGGGGAGDTGSVSVGPAPTGDSSARAPSLAEVKKELKQLNLCGGFSGSAGAAPLVKSSKAGFFPDPGTSQTEGVLPILTARLDALGKALGVTIYGISGYRTPAHSVAVGGFANDPHTKGEAEDIGVNSLSRPSAAVISEAELAKFGLYRPFDPSDDPNNTEVNHIQLIPSGGPVPLAQVTATYDPDPTCS